MITVHQSKLAGLKCSFCGLTRTGGVVGPMLLEPRDRPKGSVGSPDIYICPDCIDLVHEILHHADENAQIRFTTEPDRDE
jgi:hypothetical protein